MSDGPFLSTLSPLDDRYVRETAPLREFFSEFALIRLRVRVEIDYVIALSRVTHLVRSLNDSELELLQHIAINFSADDAGAVKAHEQTTRHDVKAIEYFLRDRLAATSLADIIEWLHFGLTSEDINLIAYAIALRDSRDQVMLPALERIITQLGTLARQYKSLPMLARTHGQPAVPTTLGKEFAVFLTRLRKEIAILRVQQFEAKLSGAVGNFNALVAAAPQIDWLTFGDDFIRASNLEPNHVTTQLLPYDNWVRYFDTVRLINSILVDFAQDVWRYISDDYLKLRAIANEVGSSTMPQKVNPIDFENAEGNLGIANALLEHYSRKLPITRLQRDLSDSTVRRTFGVALGHSLLAYTNLARGLDRIDTNEEKMRADLESHWEIVAEGAQTILRTAGVPAAYEQLKSFSRGKSITARSFEEWIEELPVDEWVKQKLQALSPFTYLGIAERIVEDAVSQ